MKMRSMKLKNMLWEGCFFFVALSLFTACESYDEMPPRIEGSSTAKLVFPIYEMNSEERAIVDAIRDEYKQFE